MGEDLIDIRQAKSVKRLTIPEKCCVYFLFKKGRLIYIGQSINLLNRLATHTHTRLTFDEVYYLEVGGHDTTWLNDIERACIINLRPAFNQSGTKSPLSERNKKLYQKYVEAHL